MPSPPAARPAAVRLPDRAPKGISFFNNVSKPRPFKRKELIHMFRGLASMLRAQINTADALKYYAQGLPNKSMVDSLLKVRDEIAAGVSVHEAFRRTERFNDMTIGLVQAGSDSGQLHHALSSLATRLSKEEHFSKAMKKATVLPSIIITVLMGAFIVSQNKIVPQVEEMLRGVNQKPDGFTAIAFKVSHITQAIWPAVVLGFITLGVTIFVSQNVRSFILGFFMSKWKLLRQMVMSLRQMTFLSTIKLLHGNGINLAKSIRVAANSVKSTPFHRELIEAADKYEGAGVPLSLAFSKYTSVDTQVVHMLSIGERSASLDTQLEMLCDMYEEDTTNCMATFTASISFIVLVIAVLLISAVFIGTFLPIFLMGPKMMQSGI